MAFKENAYYRENEKTVFLFIIQLHSVSTNNTQNEYKYPTVFLLQKTGLTGFLQMSHQALGLQGER